MFLYQLIQQTVLDAIRFLLSSLIANMETILENFQQKFSSVREKFLTFVIKFRTKQISRARKVCFKIVVKLVRKMWRFIILELYLAVDPSNLATENNVTQLAEL